MTRWVKIAPKILGHKMFRRINAPKLMPFSLTLSVTNQCNSRCMTCNIWKLYKDKPQMRNEELKLKEFETIFEKLGSSVIWFTISGGEPFLRPDLVSICKSMYEYCKPKILIIPTNGLLSQSIEHRTREILEIFEETQVIINLSLDDVGHAHDTLRGVQGNFVKAIDTFARLKTLKEENDNLNVGVHSVVSKYNVDGLLNLYDYVLRQLNPDSYICEIAEHRSELFNLKEEIMPNASSYMRLIDELCDRLRQDYLGKDGIPRVIQTFRLKYYNLVIEELKQQRQIIPCYAGFASGQISPYGDVWPCCIWAYEADMGNLRETRYDLRKIWFSKEAKRIRKKIRSKYCWCPMANVHYTNMLLNTVSMLKIGTEIIGSYLSDTFSLLAKKSNI